MKALRLSRWSGTLLPPRNPRLIRSSLINSSHRGRNTCHLQLNNQAIAFTLQRPFSCSRQLRQEEELSDSEQFLDSSHTTRSPLRRPPVSKRAQPHESAKLAAIHARLSLPARLPLETLARCLVHPTADKRPDKNNASLALLGQELLSSYTSEWLVCSYPRIPMPVLYAAVWAYCGDKVLNRVRAEWGVEEAVAPGPEVDAGLVQFQRRKAGNSLADDGTHRVKDLENAAGTREMSRPNSNWNYRRGMSSRIVYDDEFGEVQSGLAVHDTMPDLDRTLDWRPAKEATGEEGAELTPEMDDINAKLDVADQSLPTSSPTHLNDTTSEAASASFIRAVFGALYLHAGQNAVQSFHEAHILSRHLPLHNLFAFKHPTRDLSRLCKREGFEPPVARLISETGRHSRTPVFVVGVYSGQDKLGEDAGSSLAEARIRAAAQALRSWYLYTPPRDQICLPSRQTEMESQGKRWRPQMVDPGEIVT